MLEFIKSFLKSPTKTGAIAPSGKALIKEMTAKLDFKNAKTIVELGPGTGCITKALLKKMRPDARLFVLEINPAFCKNLRIIKDKRLTVLNADAKSLSRHITKADYVVSGLPLVGFGTKTHDRILREIRTLKPKLYVQFHYSPFGERLLNRYFMTESKTLVIRNVPPALVYSAQIK